MAAVDAQLGHDTNEYVEWETSVPIPDLLKTHPELRRRRIWSTDVLKPDYVYNTSVARPPTYAVKIVRDDGLEDEIYEYLLRFSDKRNHTLPCEVVRDAERPSILIMPHMTDINRLGGYITKWSLSEFLAVFLQIVEGVEFMHEHRVVHMDICSGNTAAACRREVQEHPHLTEGKMYFIDFETAQRLSAGPGVQGAIPLPETQVVPPDGMERMDPYSWDMYCVGKLFEDMAECVYRRKGPPPWLVKRIAEWLVGDERGCTSVCRCRPTAQRVRRVLSMLQPLIRTWEWCGNLVKRIRGVFVSPTI
ncbi:hypothetical protein C8Q78DRAFT_1048069 [Trametes maxima]|nr:hypothetical protein C8Q78DRAFT_1048069 [Trametes maxima]